jgi:hypothetical protein
MAFNLNGLTAHFIWALFLMFLYSGRGYWQELIESILWSHNKLHLTRDTSKSTKYYSMKVHTTLNTIAGDRT